MTADETSQTILGQPQPATAVDVSPQSQVFANNYRMHMIVLTVARRHTLWLRPPSRGQSHVPRRRVAQHPSVTRSLVPALPRRSQDGAAGRLDGVVPHRHGHLPRCLHGHRRRHLRGAAGCEQRRARVDRLLALRGCRHAARVRRAPTRALARRARKPDRRDRVHLRTQPELLRLRAHAVDHARCRIRFLQAPVHAAGHHCPRHQPHRGARRAH